MSGLSIVGRDKYGVFPLRGKLLNVRDLSPKKALENEELGNLRIILGLVLGKEYRTEKDRAELRYGKVMLMTDQDHDGKFRTLNLRKLTLGFDHQGRTLRDYL